MQKYTDTLSVVTNKNLTSSQHIFRPHLIDIAVKCFLDNFGGKIAYAVKVNPEKHTLKQLYNAGIRSFDVASLDEVKHIKSLFPEAYLFFMHTVKARQAINSGYHEYNVKDFSLDSFFELSKILQETNNARDLNLHVRVAVPNLYSKVSLAGKFGIETKEAINLLREARKHAVKLGISFHVGSQCINPDAYKMALATVENIIKKSGTKVDIINVGGGFPSIYPGMSPVSIETYFKVIQKYFNKLRENNPDLELMCEAGRALVAESGGSIVQVELVKGQYLYINDGTYGGLFDAGAFNLIYPVKAIRPEPITAKLSPFSLFGPTCDAIDFMPGPFYLPCDIKEGEYFEIGQLGAYSRSLATKFNGFSQEKEVVIVEDLPLMSMYTTGRLTDERLINYSLYKNHSNEIQAITA